jgi:anaerobic selenocysteine-containing dehydrogenase
MATKRSYCRICAAYCGVRAEVEAGRLMSVTGDPEHALSRGYTCVKGRRLPERVHHPTRLRASWARDEDGTPAPIPTERALDEIAARLSAIIDEHGPRAVATYTGTGCWGDGALREVEKAWHQGIGSVMRFSSASIDQPAKMIFPWHLGMWGGGVQAFETADVILLVGQNPIVSGQYQHGGPPYPTALREARRRGLKMIVIDPRCTELARQADVHLAPVPGEDPTLLAGMLRVILEEERHDAAFCNEHVRGLDALRKAVAPFTPDYVAQRAGVEAGSMIAAARLFAQGPRGSASTGTGPSMAPRPNLMEHLVQCLNTVCGRWGREGDAVNAPSLLTPMLPRPAQALPEEFMPPEMSRIGNTERSRIRGLQQVYHEMPTAALADEILTPGDGQVRALIVVGGNPVLAWPDQPRTVRALRALDLLVCIDIRSTPTTERADYVIAGTHFLERPELNMLGDYFFEKPFAQFTDAVCEPEGDVLAEWRFFTGIAERMGTPLELPGGRLDPEALPDPVALYELCCPAPKVPIREIAEHPGGYLSEIDVRVSAPIPGVEARLDLAAAPMLQELAEVRGDPDREPGRYGVGGAFTHLLISRRVKHMQNSIGQDLRRGERERAYNPAYLHPDDLAELGFVDGELVEIESEDGRIAAVVEAEADLRRGVVSMAHGYGGDPESEADPRQVGSATPALVSVEHDYDPISGNARQSAIPVRLRRRSASARSVGA